MKNFLKRTVAVLMILLAIGCIAPFANIVKAADSGPSTKGLITNTGDKITRAEWLHNLAVVFEMTVEDEIYPDNYFSDLEDTHEYYYDVLLNVNFGVVDVEAGGEVMPNGVVTRSFASHTLNYCLGYQLENDTYTFTDYALCEYPADAQIAINRGWFTLVNGKFCPEMKVTDAEASKMLEEAIITVEGETIDENHKNEYEFDSSVIEIPDGTELSISDKVIAITNCKKTLKNGDKFAVYQNEIPKIYEALSVSVAGDVTTVTVNPNFEGNSLISSFDAEGIVNINPEDIVLEDGVKLTVLKNNTTNYMLRRNKVKIADTLKFEPTFDFGETIAVSSEIKIEDLYLYYDLNYSNGQKDVLCYAQGNTSIKSNVNTNGSWEPFKKTVNLAYIPFGGIGYLSLAIELTFSGEMGVVVSGELKVGFDYKDSSGVRMIKSFKAKSFSAYVEATTALYLVGKLGVNEVLGCYASAFAKVGAKVEFRKDWYDDGKVPTTCHQYSAYLFAEYGVSGRINGDFELKYIVYDDTNSPIRIIKHYDDNIEVAVCKRGHNINYYTKGDSSYSDGGYIKGSRNGLDRNGNPYIRYTYELDEKNNATITSYKGNVTALQIPEKIDGYTVVRIGANAFSKNRHLRYVYISDSITAIDDNSFEKCNNLKEVKLPKALTWIGAYAFLDCTNLNAINIPKTLTSIGYYDGAANLTAYPFTGCDSLKNVSIESGITKIPDNLLGNSGIELLEIPDTVTEIGSSCFRNCTNLSYIKVSDSVTSIGDFAFLNCISLEKIELPKDLIRLGAYAFYGCSSLRSIEIPKTLENVGFYDGRLNRSAYPFTNCINLKTASFESGITRIPNNLFGNSSLETIQIPDSVTSIGDNAFINSKYLESITWNACLEEIGNNCFRNCEKLKEIIFPKSLKFLGDNAFNNCTQIGSVFIPKNLEKGSHAFDGCLELKNIELEEGISCLPNGLFYNTGIEKISIPNTIKSIGWDTFGYCASLEEIVLNDGLLKIDKTAFRNTAIHKVVVPNTVKEMYEGVFRECKELKEVTLPKTKQHIQSSMFEGCTALEKIELPKNITHISNHAFKNCTALREIVWSENLVSIDRYAFENCDAFTELNVPVTVENICEGAFYDCDSLTSVTIPNSVKSIGKGAFYDCDTLTNVTLGNGLEAIPDSAFEHCDVLAEIVLPYRVASIGSNAFKDCVKFTSITIPRATTKIADNAFSYLDRLTINGVTGTYAETYAKEKGIKFVNKSVPATKVELSETNLSIANGATTTLVLNITPVNFTDAVAWKSSDDKIATIDSTGKVTAKGIGTATIKVDVGSVSASCKVTVVQPVTKVNIDKSSVDLQAHDTVQLKVTVGPDTAANKAVKWTSSDETVATVDQNGLVKALKKGSVTIKCEALDGSGKSDTCTVNVKNNGVIAVTVSELESTHDYPVDCTDFWQYTIKGASKLDVTFDSRTNIEDGFDYLYIYDADGKEVGKYTGTVLAGKTITVNGDTARLQLASDKSGTAWGFKVSDVKQASGGHLHSYTSKVTQEATCWREGTKTFSCSCGDTYTEKIDKLDHEVYRWEVKKKSTCTEKGVEWSYCLNCDMDLERDIPATGHTTIKYTRRATPDEDGAYVTACDVCNDVFEEIPFSRPTVFKLSTSTCTYNGKTRTPKATVKDAKGKTLKEGTDYEIIYPSGRKLPGKYDITVLFIGEYLGEKHLTFTIKPKAPAKISATQSSSVVKLTWSKSTGATGYRVYQYSPSKDKFVLKASVKGTTTYRVTGLNAGTEYQYKIKSYYKADDGTVIWGGASKAFVTATDPAKPTLKVSTTEKGKAALSWINVSGESGYQIYYSTSKSSGYKKFTNISANKTKGTVSKLTSGKTYYFKVRAYKKVDGKTFYGDFSSVKSVKVK